MAPLVLFLACYNHSEQRGKRRGQFRGLKLQQQQDWFQRRVAECGDDGGHFHLDNHRLQLLVRISPGSEYRGALTPWDAEEQFLWDSLERPLDAYSLHIDQVVFVDNAPVAPSIDWGKPRGFIRSFTGGIDWNN